MLGEFGPLALLPPSRAFGFGRLQPRLEPRFYYGRGNAFLIYSRWIKAHGHLLGRQVDVSLFNASQAGHLLLDLLHTASAVHALNCKVLLSTVCRHVATSQFNRRAVQFALVERANQLLDLSPSRSLDRCIVIGWRSARWVAGVEHLPF